MFGITIDRTLIISITRQLQNQIRKRILNGNLVSGDKMPPTRIMAKELGISRNIVIDAYEQLIAEGYLVGRGGSGTFVVDVGRLTDHRRTEASPHSYVMPSAENKGISFIVGNPDTTLFPKEIWNKLVKNACVKEGVNEYNDFDIIGNEQLRRSIASYLFRTRGILCDYQQIIITQGAAGALDLLARALKNNKRIVVEDPCIHFVRRIFQDFDYEIAPVQVDEQGICVEQLYNIADTDLIYITPSHQFPLGGVLPAARRIALLQYAFNRDAYIIEDDYDCELRYSGEPLQPLQSLVPERVIYLGSFSKILMPSLWLGYLVLPKQLCNDVIRHREECNLWVNPTLQLALAEFLNHNYMDKHIYKVKKAYERKRLFLIDCIHEIFGESAKITGEDAGLHLTLRLSKNINGDTIKSLHKEGIEEVEMVEEYCILKGLHQNELILGYGNLTLGEIERGIIKICEIAQ